MLAAIAEYEWVILMLLFVALLGWELHRTRRDIRPPLAAALPATRFWRVPRETRSDDGRAEVVRTFEDTPFYSRSLLSARLAGEAVRPVHESLSLDRFRNPLVRLMLPFRMPRRA